jgi:hypothetical protein
VPNSKDYAGTPLDKLPPEVYAKRRMAARTLYCELGRERSLNKTRQEFCVALGNVSNRTIEKWSKEDNWMQAARDYDIARAQEIIERVERVNKMQQQDLPTSLELLAKWAINRVYESEPPIVTVQDARSMMGIADRAVSLYERIAGPESEINRNKIKRDEARKAEEQRERSASSEQHVHHHEHQHVHVDADSLRTKHASAESLLEELERTARAVKTPSTIVEALPAPTPAEQVFNVSPLQVDDAEFVLEPLEAAPSQPAKHEPLHLSVPPVAMTNEDDHADSDNDSVLDLGTLLRQHHSPAPDDEHNT